MARTRRNGRVALLAMMLGATAVGSIVGVLGGARSAHADPIADQEVTYTLYFQGKPAGTHTLRVRHFAPRRANGAETRIVESYEDIRGADVPEALWRRTRASARASGSTLSFTAVTETGQPDSGRVTEVNGQRHNDGTWTLNITRGLATETAQLRRSQADLCTLDLLDPVLHVRLIDRPIVRMVDIATGQVIEGRTADMGEMTAELSAGQVGVRRASFETEGHTWHWDWNLEGLLVQYDTRLGTGPLTARADTVPGMRTWGAIEAPTRFDNGVPIVQDDL